MILRLTKTKAPHSGTVRLFFVNGMDFKADEEQMFAAVQTWTPVRSESGA